MKPLWLFLLFVVGNTAGAHPLDLGLLQVEAKTDGIEASLDLSPEAAGLLLRLSLFEVTPLNVKTRAPRLLGETLAKGMLLADGKPCAWKDPRAERLPTSVRLAAASPCQVSREILWDVAFVRDARLPRSFQVLGRWKSGAAESAFMADASEPLVSLSASPPSFLGFFKMGIAHIGAAPTEWLKNGRLAFPEGIDHVLFVLALCLAGGTLGSLLLTATGFTVGHSVTLLAGTLGWVHVSSHLVESAIALSIAYMAAESLWVSRGKHRWVVATVFGLVHGLGFASALSGLHLAGHALVSALLGFNLGVEAGQLALIAVFGPIVAWLRRYPVVGRQYALRTGSVAIALAGAYWFVERAFL